MGNIILMGGCMLALLAQPGTEETTGVDDSAVLADYHAFLGVLPMADMLSANRAAERYVLDVVRAGQGARDQAFLEFLQFYSRLAESVTRELLYKDGERVMRWAERLPCPRHGTKPNNPVDFIYSGNIDPPQDMYGAQYRIMADPTFSALLRHSGFQWQGDGEGSYYLAHTEDFVPGIFVPYVSPALREYVQLRSREVSTRLSVDGGLSLEADELARRTRAWEKYCNEYPDSPLKKSAVYLSKVYLATFVKTCRYSFPDKESGENNLFVQEWEKYAEEHRGAKSAEFVGECLNLHRANHFEITESTPEYQEFIGRFDAYLDSLGEGPKRESLVAGDYLPDLFNDYYWG